MSRAAAFCQPFALCLAVCLFPQARARAAEAFDVLIRGGTVYDGTGGPPRRADVGLRGDRIAAVGDLAGATAKTVVDARGLAVAPGFINMLSWSTESLLVDGRGQSEVRQGVTTQVMLLGEDQSGIGTAYFITAEENVRKLVPLPWVSFGSDEAAQAPEGVFLKSLPHPRAYGNFARVLGKYVREEKLLPLEAAVRKLTSLPATNLGLDRRGLLREGYFADVVVFDPKTVSDRATYDKPHRYAVGVKHVFVNGARVLKDGEHTGALPGRALWGPGKADK